jgi:3-methyladenine DNA glycosylase/8-oxoguanine DNA glycosylase
MRTRLQLTPAPPFDFRGTAHSHGWVVLAPNEWDRDAGVMQRVERLPSSKVVGLTIQGDGTLRKPIIDVAVEHKGRLSRRDGKAIERSVNHMFRLDEDLRRFYTLCRKRGVPWTQVTCGLGRLLRSPDLFEDIVKTICTTNIQWSGTQRIVAGLVNEFAEPLPTAPDRKAFPTAETIAATHPDELAGRVRMGYRAPYVHEIATRIAAGELNLASLQDPELPTIEIKQRLTALKGVGPYAAASLMMLLGRYDDLPVDSVYRDFVRKRFSQTQAHRRPNPRDLRGLGPVEIPRLLVRPLDLPLRRLRATSVSLC